MPETIGEEHAKPGEWRGGSGLDTEENDQDTGAPITRTGASISLCAQNTVRSVLQAPETTLVYSANPWGLLARSS